MQTFEEASENLKAKLRKAGSSKVTDEEYKAWVASNYATIAKKEAEQARQNRIENLQRIGVREDELELAWSAVKPNFSDGHKAVQAVRLAYQNGWGLVFLWGSYGQAKTLVGKILVATALRDGKHAAYANVSSVLDDIRLAFDEQEHKTTELLRRMDYWIQRDVLFIDELDKSNDTPWARERLFQLLDQRYSRAIRQEALTVIASNRGDGELDGYLTSRLRDKRLGPIVHLDGPDGRQFMPADWKH